MQTLAEPISSSPRPLLNLQGGGASTVLSLSGTNSITFTANTIAFLLTECNISYTSDGKDESTYSRTNIIGIYSASTGKALYANIPMEGYNSVSSTSISDYSNNIVITYIGRRSGVGIDPRQETIGTFVNKTFTLNTLHNNNSYYPFSQNTCKFSYIVLG